MRFIVQTTLTLFGCTLISGSSAPLVATGTSETVKICHWVEVDDAYHPMTIDLSELVDYLEQGDVLADEYILDYDLDGYFAIDGPILPCPDYFFILKKYAFGEDCDDVNASNHPGAEEICADGMDNNCSGEIDDEAICDIVPKDALPTQ